MFFVLRLNCVLCGEECGVHLSCTAFFTVALTAIRHCNFCYFSAWKFIRNVSTRCTIRFPRKLCLYGLQGLWYLPICPKANVIRKYQKYFICSCKNNDLERPKTLNKKMGFSFRGFFALFSAINPRPTPWFRASKKGGFGVHFLPYFLRFFYSIAVSFDAIFLFFFNSFSNSFFIPLNQFFDPLVRFFLEELSAFFWSIQGYFFLRWWQ